MAAIVDFVKVDEAHRSVGTCVREPHRDAQRGPLTNWAARPQRMLRTKDEQLARLRSVRWRRRMMQSASATTQAHASLLLLAMCERQRCPRLIGRRGRSNSGLLIPVARG